MKIVVQIDDGDIARIKGVSDPLVGNPFVKSRIAPNLGSEATNCPWRRYFSVAIVAEESWTT